MTAWISGDRSEHRPLTQVTSAPARGHSRCYSGVAKAEKRRDTRPAGYPVRSAEVDDGGDGAAALGALVGRGDRDEHGGVAGDRRRDAANGGLDPAVPVDVGVVEHGVAAPADVSVLRGLALEEHVD